MVSALQDVINVSKKFLPGMAKGFFSPKITLHIGDGFEFMKQNQDAFDIIITDSSDPVGRCRPLKTVLFLLCLFKGWPHSGFWVFYVLQDLPRVCSRSLTIS